jgi:two-component system, OmpR family, sensor histidine kinase CiaH
MKPMFHSARLKLTMFYLAILLVFSLTITLSTRGLAQHEFDDSDVAQRGAVHRLFLRLYSIPPPPTYQFNSMQQDQAAEVRDRLNRDVILINLAALIIGGVLSYWYAGRTLKPIEDAHEAQRRFAADASHELRTPLANLKLENEVFLRQKSFKPKEAKQLIESNLEEVQRLESLAVNLLSLTQYEQAELKLQTLDVKSLVTDAITQVAKLADAKKVTFEQDVASAHVLGNAESLTQLLVIVLDNALKYGPDKSKVFIDGAQNDGRYSLSIRDQGSGIALVDLPHIFDRLYRGDKARTSSTGGYGLGLALAREIARANEATITARNIKGSGARFTIILNAAKAKK